MSTFPWTEDPPGARATGVYCRGCSAPIWKLNTEADLWENAAGITVCVKARREDTGGGQHPDYVFHQPMPAGLVGAPG